MASGGLTHNLHDIVWDADEDQPLAYVAEFRDWFSAALERQDIATLLDYQEQAPHAARAHPSPDHLLPLFVALGAAGNSFATKSRHTGYTFGALAMDALEFTSTSKN